MLGGADEADVKADSAVPAAKADCSSSSFMTTPGVAARQAAGYLKETPRAALLNLLDGTGKTGVGLAFFDAVEIGEEELQAASAEATRKAHPTPKTTRRMNTLLANDDAVTYHRNHTRASPLRGVHFRGGRYTPRAVGPTKRLEVRGIRLLTSRRVQSALAREPNAHHT